MRKSKKVGAVKAALKNVQKKLNAKKLVLGETAPTLEEIHDASIGMYQISLSTATKARIKKSRDYLLREAKSGKTIYGVNTGFGLLSNVKIDHKELGQLQINLLRSHAVGTGAAITIPQARKMILLRALSLTQGHSGVSVQLVEKLCEIFNRGVTPWIPEQGSVGASGDLSPLAHLALVLIGEGQAYFQGKLMSGAEALKRAKIKPITLGEKEGLALINGTQFMLALGIEALLSAENLLRCGNLSGAMTLEAMRGTLDAFDPLVHAVRHHEGQSIVAEEIRRLLGNGKKSEIAKSHAGCDRVQDPYSLRCIPQVHGSSLEVLAFVRGILEREVISVTDNPLVFDRANKILSGGNFHGQILAMAMDFLSIAVAELGSISEQRIEKLVNPQLSGLPAFLVPRSGLNSGFMIVQVAAASIVSENKTLCHPASVDSIPTSADKEDHVSMGAWAARKALKVCENTRQVIAMEFIAAAQGIELLRPLRSSPHIENAFTQIRRLSRFRRDDQTFYEDFDRIAQWSKQL